VVADLHNMGVRHKDEGETGARQRTLMITRGWRATSRPLDATADATADEAAAAGVNEAVLLMGAPL